MTTIQLSVLGTNTVIGYEDGPTGISKVDDSTMGITGDFHFLAGSDLSFIGGGVLTVTEISTAAGNLVLSPAGAVETPEITTGGVNDLTLSPGGSHVICAVGSTLSVDTIDTSESGAGDLTLSPTGNVVIPGDLDVGGVIIGEPLGVFIGATLDTAAVSASSDGATVTFSLEQSGGGDVRVWFSDGIHTHDCTPADTLALTPGTDIAPTLNYVYILQSTKAITASTSDWPSAEHAPLATVLVQSAASVQTDGVYKFHAWTDHVANDETGHLAHLNFWIRQQPATWSSGALCTPAVGVGTFDIAVSSGTVLQLHSHAWPSFDTATGSEVMIVNDSATAYKRVGDLTGELTDASGASMSSSYFNLVIWGVVSEDSGDCQVMVNLPTDSYVTSTDAISDTEGTSVYDIPADYVGCAFLIARLTIRHQVAGGGTWSLSQNTDLRGFFPSTGAGAGAGGGATELIELTDVDTAADTANFVLSTPNGTTGQYSGRAVVGADITAALGALEAGTDLATVSGGLALSPNDGVVIIDNEIGTPSGDLTINPTSNLMMTSMAEIEFYNAGSASQPLFTIDSTVSTRPAHIMFDSATTTGFIGLANSTPDAPFSSGEASAMQLGTVGDYAVQVFSNDALVAHFASDEIQVAQPITTASGDLTLNPANHVVLGTGVVVKPAAATASGIIACSGGNSVLQLTGNPEDTDLVMAFGDVNADGNGTLFTVDDANEKLMFNKDFFTPNVKTSAGNLTLAPAGDLAIQGNTTTTGTIDGRDILDDGQAGDNLITLSGVARDATDLGTFTGTIITDSLAIKPVLQELETYVAGALMDSEVSSLSGIKTLTVPDSTTISSFAATVLDDVDAAAARTTLEIVKNVSLIAIDHSTALTTGDGKLYFRVPADLDGLALASVGASLGAAKSTSGLPTIQLAKGDYTPSAGADPARTWTDLLAVAISIDVGEWDSKNAATAATIKSDGTEDVNEGDLIRVDIDTAGTGAQGLYITLGFS